MILRRVLFGISIAVCIMLLHSQAYAQSASTQPTSQSASIPQPINPITGPSFPCPQPLDPLAQLVCSTPQLALLDMQFVQSFEALLQEVGTAGHSSLLQQDIQFNVNVRSACNIADSQASSPSPTPPPAAPPGAAQCVIPLYQQQIAVWKARLQGAAAEEANRPIQDQLTLQSRLQALGFLPAKAQIDGVFGTGTRTAIIQWQTSVGRQPTGLLGNADAQALLPNAPPSAANPPPNPSVQTQVQSPAPIAPAQPNPSVETAWAPYTQYAACMLSKGFQLQTFVQDGVLPTDAIAASVLNSCIQTSASQLASLPASKTTAPNNASNPTPSAAPTSVPSNNSASAASSNNASNTAQNSNTAATPNASKWIAYLYKNSVCALSAPDGKLTLMNDGQPEYVALIIGASASPNTPASLQFGNNTELQLTTMDSSGGWLLSKGGAGYDVDVDTASDFENNLRNSSDDDSFSVTIGTVSFTENLTGAATAVGQFDNCVDQLLQSSQTNSSTSNSTSNQAPEQDNSNTQPQATQTYTVTIQCVEQDNASDGGYNNAGYTCMEPGNGDTDLSDGGSVLISDATGNHNYGALDFVKAVNNSGNNGGNIQLTLTPPFEVKAQVGGFGEPFQLDVQIQNSSGKVVYDNKTVQAFGTIDVTDSDLSH